MHHVRRPTTTANCQECNTNDITSKIKDLPLLRTGGLMTCHKRKGCLTQQLRVSASNFFRNVWQKRNYTRNKNTFVDRGVGDGACMGTLPPPKKKGGERANIM